MVNNLDVLDVTLQQSFLYFTRDTQFFNDTVRNGIRTTFESLAVNDALTLEDHFRKQPDVKSMAKRIHGLSVSYLRSVMGSLCDIPLSNFKGGSEGEKLLDTLKKCPHSEADSTASKFLRSFLEIHAVKAASNTDKRHLLVLRDNYLGAGIRIYDDWAHVARKKGSLIVICKQSLNERDLRVANKRICFASSSVEAGTGNSRIVSKLEIGEAYFRLGTRHGVFNLMPILNTSPDF
jgi:hypothetical protein